jgi:hypothetical protein
VSTRQIAEYDSPRLNEPVPQPEITGSFARARLGPFHLPRGVSVALDGTHRLLFRMHYENDEAAESYSRKLLQRDVEVTLAKYSKKILEVCFANPVVAFSSGVPLLDPSAAAQWCSELSADRQFACTQNTVIVSAILDAMPAEVRTQLESQFLQRPLR